MIPSLRRSQRIRDENEDCVEQGHLMEKVESQSRNRNWVMNIMTDVHFWVPVVVLIAGLLLLGSLR
jgi:hypothetical protein